MFHGPEQVITSGGYNMAVHIPDQTPDRSYITRQKDGRTLYSVCQSRPHVNARDAVFDQRLIGLGHLSDASYDLSGVVSCTRIRSDLAPSGYHLFGTMETPLRKRPFAVNDKLQLSSRGRDALPKRGCGGA